MKRQSPAGLAPIFLLGLAALLSSCDHGGDHHRSSQASVSDKLLALGAINLQQGAVWQLNRPIELAFNQPVDFSTVNLNTISIRKVDGAPAVGEFFLRSPDVVVFQPRCPTLEDLSDAGLQPGGVAYELVVPGTGQGAQLTVLSLTGNPLERGTVRTFTTPVSLLPAALFHDPVPGPPTPVVRSDAPGDVTLEATYLEIGGDPEARHYFERNAATGAITLDPPLFLPLNLLSLESSGVALVLQLDQPVDFRPANIHPERLPWQFRDQAGVWQPLATTVALESNCTGVGAVVRIQPSGILPPEAALRAVVSQEFRDIVGETNLLPLEAFAWARVSPAPSPLVDDSLERFDDTQGFDDQAPFAEPFAEWANEGTLRAAFSFAGTGGPNGDFDWLIPAGTTFVFNTDVQTISGGPNFSNTSQQTVTGGVIDVRRLRVEAGAILAFIGPNPVKLSASGTVEILGRIRVDGTSSSGVNTLNTTNIPELGAPGQAGGGRGGTGSPETTASSPKGGDGYGAFDAPGGGGIGGETGWNNEGLNQLNKRRGAGGGGGVLGKNQAASVGTGTWDQRFIGLDAEDGFTNLAAGSMGAISGPAGPLGGAAGPSPFSDGDPANDFFGSMLDTATLQRIQGELIRPWAGSGGGGGGDASFVGVGGAFPQSPFNPNGDEKGAGGGGGAGGLHILALGDIVFGAAGRISARGGWGGGGENTSFLNRVGGGSGGGSGGHVILETAGRVDMSQVVLGGASTLDAAINACGGQGGAGINDTGGATSVGQTGPLADACPQGYTTSGLNGCRGHIDGAGGDGGPGLIQLHTHNGLSSPNPDILLPAGMTLAGLCKPTPLCDTGACRLVPGFGRTSRARSNWVHLGEGSFELGSATPKNVVFEFQGIDPVTGQILTTSNQVVQLPPLFAPQTVVPAPGLPHIAQNGSTLVLQASSLPPEHLDNPGLLRDQVIELAALLAPATVARFVVQTVEHDTASQLMRLTVSSEGPTLDTFQPAGGVTATVRPAFFRVLASGAPDQLPASAQVQIRFQATVRDAQGNPSTSLATPMTSDISVLNSSPQNADFRFVRWEVLFDVDAAGQGLMAGTPIPALQFLRLPFRYN